MMAGIRWTTAWLADRWDRVRGSFWFVPAAMCAVSAGLAYGALAMDRGAPARWLQQRWWGYGGGAEGATAVLQTIAGSMMTIAGVVFSLTLVALSLASAQFGPRLLRNFMRDAVTQTVLGAFVATFLYSVLVLLEVRRPPDGAFVPHVAVGIGVLLAMASMAMLVYFIHHVAVSIQADELIARIGRELSQRTDELFPEHLGDAADSAQARLDALPKRMAGGRSVASAADGYVQRVDAESLMQLASEHDLLVRLEARPGDFVLEGAPLATAWPAERLAPSLMSRLRDAFVLGSQRTPTQDMAFALRQLVEVALRALSPSINDPYTAIACIDRLSAALHRLAGRANPAQCRVDSAGTMRLIAAGTTFAGLVENVFDPLRLAAAGQPVVTVHIVNALAGLLATVRRPEDQRAIRRQLERVRDIARDGAASSSEWPAPAARAAP
jgi:uncharacterized membrane protein